LLVVLTTCIYSTSAIFPCAMPEGYEGLEFLSAEDECACGLGGREGELEAFCEITRARARAWTPLVGETVVLLV
jgi:hypothetical protein